MNKWDALKGMLRGFSHISVKAKAGDFELTFQKQLYREKLVTGVFVNGVQEGKWYKLKEVNGDPLYPEGRFWCPKKMRAYPPAKHKELKRLFGKREADKMTSLRVTHLMPYFNTPRALVSHYKKHVPELVLVCKKCDGQGSIDYPNISGHDYSETCKTCNGKGVFADV